jgi:hypothetical protein
MHLRPRVVLAATRLNHGVLGRDPLGRITRLPDRHPHANRSASPVFYRDFACRPYITAHKQFFAGKKICEFAGSRIKSLLVRSR